MVNLSNVIGTTLPPSTSTIKSLQEEIENSPVILSAIHSSTDNVVKQNVYDKLGQSIKSRYLGSAASFSKTINERLSTAETNTLTSQYPSVDFKFTQRNNHGHAFASASRRVELEVLLGRVQASAKTDLKSYGEYDALVTDIGGNFPTHIQASRGNVHSCSPVIDVHDSNRYTNRFMRVCDQVATGVISDPARLELVNQCNSAMAGESTKFLCVNKFQHCTVKTPYAISLHSIYDLSLDDVAIGMRNKNIITIHGCFVYSDQVLLRKSGRFSHLQMSWRISDKYIEFYFDDGTAPYKHRLVDYFKFLGVSYFQRGDVTCYVEMLENVDGIQYFKINKLLKPYSQDSVYNHRIPLPSMRGKLRVEFNFRDKDYGNFMDVFADSLASEPTLYEPYIRDIRTSNGDYTTVVNTLLSRCCELYPLEGRSLGGTISFLVDEELTMKALAWACNSTDKRFMAGEVYSYVRSLASTMFVGTTVVRRYEENDPVKLFLTAHAIYIYAYEYRYKTGIEVESYIKGVAYNRSVQKRGIFRKYINKYLINWDAGMFNEAVARLMPVSPVGAAWTAWSDSLYNDLKADINFNILITVPDSHLTVPVRVPSSNTNIPVEVDTTTVIDKLQTHVKPIVVDVLRKLHSRIATSVEYFDVDTFLLRYPTLSPKLIHSNVCGEYFYHYDTIHLASPQGYADIFDHMLRRNKASFYFPVYYDLLPTEFHGRRIVFCRFDVNNVNVPYYHVHAKNRSIFKRAVDNTDALSCLRAHYVRIASDNSASRPVKVADNIVFEVKKCYLAESSEVVSFACDPVHDFSLAPIIDAENDLFLSGHSPSLTPFHKSQSVIDRAGAKLADIDSSLGCTLSAYTNVLDLCSNPGGFSVYMKRRQPSSTYWCVSAKGLPNCLPRKHTLANITYIDSDFSHFDLCDTDMQDYVVDRVGRVSLVLADGAVDVMGDFDSKSGLNEAIIISEIRVATAVVAVGGSFLLKIYSFDGPRIPILLANLSSDFATVRVYKPSHSSTLNRERYVLFHDRKKMSNFPSAMLNLRNTELFRFHMTVNQHIVYRSIVRACARLDIDLVGGVRSIVPEVVHGDDLDELTKVVSAYEVLPSAPPPPTPPPSPTPEDITDIEPCDKPDVAESPVTDPAEPEREPLRPTSMLTKLGDFTYVHPMRRDLIIKRLPVPGDGDCCYHAMFKGSTINSRALFYSIIDSMDDPTVNSVKTTVNRRAWGGSIDFYMLGFYTCYGIGEIMGDGVCDRDGLHYVISHPGHFDATVNLCRQHYNKEVAYDTFEQTTILFNFIEHQSNHYYVAAYTNGCVICDTYQHDGPKYLFNCMPIPAGYRLVPTFKGVVGRLVIPKQELKPVQNRNVYNVRSISVDDQSSDTSISTSGVPLPSEPSASEVTSSELYHDALDVVDTSLSLRPSNMMPPPVKRLVATKPVLSPKICKPKPLQTPKPPVRKISPSVKSLTPEVRKASPPISVVDPQSNIVMVEKVIPNIPQLRVYRGITNNLSQSNGGWEVVFDMSTGAVDSAKLAEYAGWFCAMCIDNEILIIRDGDIDVTLFTKCKSIKRAYVYDVPCKEVPLPVFTDNDRINAMLEQRYMWATDDHRTEIECKLYFDEVVVNTDAYHTHSIDSSRGCFTVASGVGEWVVMPTRDPAGWCYAYDGNDFVNIEGFITGNHTFDRSNAPADGAYVITKNTAIMINDQLLDAVKDDVVDRLDFDIEIVEGVPGGGKTQYIVDKHNPVALISVIATATRDSANNIKDRVKKLDTGVMKKKYRTLDSLLVNISDYSNVKVESLWVDEAMMKHFGECLWAAYKLGVKRLYLCGDRGQISYFSSTEFKPQYSSPIGDQISYLNVSYRVPMDVAYCLSGLDDHAGRVYPNHVRTKNKTIRSMHATTISDLPTSFDPGVQVLVFTQDEKNSLIGRYPNTRTIGEYQGKQSDHVVVIRNRDANVSPFSDLAQIIVAMSRHKVKMTYYTCKEDQLYGYIGAIAEATDMEISTAGTHGGAYVFNTAKTQDNRHTPRLSAFRQIPFYEVRMRLPYTNVLSREDPDLVRVITDHGQTGYVHSKPGFIAADLYPAFNDVIPVDTNVPFCSDPLNTIREYVRMIKPGCDIRPSRYSQEVFQQDDQYLGNIEFRQRDVSNIPHTNDCFTPKLETPMWPPFENTVKGILKTFNERNGDVPQLSQVTHAEAMANTMVTAFKTSYIRDLKLLDYYTNDKIVPNVDTMTEWLDTQKPDVLKHIRSTETFAVLDKLMPQYTYMLKRNAKPNLDDNPQNKFSSPQAIVFPEKVYNYLFCPMVRDMKHRLYSVLRTDKILYSDVDIQDFETILNNRFPVDSLPEYRYTAEIDFSKYDKSQNLVSLLFEIKMMELLGMQKQHIAAWLVMHLFTLVSNAGMGLSFIIELQRKSGDAMTWLGNTLFLMAVLAMILGPELVRHLIGVFSGDDNYFFGRRYIDIQYAAKMAAALFNLELKIMRYKTPYFCSKFMLPTHNGWKFVPDVWKLIIKLGRKDLVSLDHIEQYRRSLQDNIVSLRDRNLYPYVSLAMRDRYKLDFDCDHLIDNLITLIDSKSKFRDIYYLEFNDTPAKYTKLPTLDI